MSNAMKESENSTTLMQHQKRSASVPSSPILANGESRIPRFSPKHQFCTNGGKTNNTSNFQSFQMRQSFLPNNNNNNNHSNNNNNNRPSWLGNCSKNIISPRQEYNHEELFPVIKENSSDDSTPRRRSNSLSLTPCKPRTRHNIILHARSPCGDDFSDADSIKSYGSTFSTTSACDHANFALNGTTWSGRTRKYVVHCSNHSNDGDEYLTPTQRAARQIRKFQALLREARKEIEVKEDEIQRLTKEVVELRLYKASLNSPEERTDSSDAPTVREKNPESPDESPSRGDDILCVVSSSSVNNSPRTPERRTLLLQNEPSSSLVDSGHFEDGSLHSKESVQRDDISVTDSSSLRINRNDFSPSRDEERKKIVNHYENRIEEMHRRHVDEIQNIKQNHNDKVESLLNQLTDMSTKYCDLRPSYETAESRVRELESEIEKLKAELAEKKALLAQQEEFNKQMYLKMYVKGQEAARIEQDSEASTSSQVVPKNKTKVEVSELLRQLTVTQAELENLKPIKDSSYVPDPRALAMRGPSLLSVQEAVSLWVLGTRKVMYKRIVESRNSQKALDPEITLQFLKSAIYYFLTDKDNVRGHLNAIESILGFTDTEKLNIDRLYGNYKK